MSRSSFNVSSSAVAAPGTIITNLTLFLIAIVIGFAGNAKVCYFFVQRQDLRKVPHFLFASLAVNGIISSVLSLPSRLAMLALVGLGRINYAKPAFDIVISSSFLCAVVNSFSLGTFFFKLSDLTHNAIFIYYIMGNVLNAVTLIIVIVTAIRVIRTIRSSTLPNAASLHRRQENKLTWLTYKISGVCVACWVPQFICSGLLASGFHSDIVLKNALVITSTVGYYNYVLNPLVYYGILKERPGREAANRRGRLPR